MPVLCDETKEVNTQQSVHMRETTWKRRGTDILRQTENGQRHRGTRSQMSHHAQLGKHAMLKNISSCNLTLPSH